jgi:hypothetical protein
MNSVHPSAYSAIPALFSCAMQMLPFCFDSFADAGMNSVHPSAYSAIPALFSCAMQMLLFCLTLLQTRG